MNFVTSLSLVITKNIKGLLLAALAEGTVANTDHGNLFPAVALRRPGPTHGGRKVVADKARVHELAVFRVTGMEG